jgi:NAD(P)-dependent dehydrogenase (short-subunit alcohol dehydrogenase family)
MRAVVIGATGGIGGAMARRLAAEGAEVIGLSRRDGLDLLVEETVAAALAGLGEVDLIFVATGALEIGGVGPEKSLRSVDPAALAAQYALNAIGPLLVLKHGLRLLPRGRAAHFVALSARVGSIGDNRLGGWYGYRAAKAGLNQFLHTAAVEVARSHPLACVLALHPGTVATGLTAAHRGNHPAMAPDESAEHLWRVIRAQGPAQSGAFLDWRGETVVW